MARYCMRFYCDELGDRYCCADCYLRKDCANPCLNHPTRCGLGSSDGRPINRRGGTHRPKPRKIRKEMVD